MKIRRLIPLRNAQMFNRRFLRYNFAKMKFWQQKIIGDFCKLSKDSAVSLRIEPTTFVLIDILGFHYGTSVLYSCTSMLKFPYLERGLIIDQPQVTEFGKSTANRRRRSSAIYLADSFCQHYSALWSAWQDDPNDPQERCAMARTSCARL